MLREEKERLMRAGPNSALDGDAAFIPRKPRKPRLWGQDSKPQIKEPRKRRVAGMPEGFNPLVQSGLTLPRYSDAGPQHLVGATHMAVDQFGSDFEMYQIRLQNEIEQNEPQLEWKKFARSLERMIDRIDRAWGAVNFMRDANRLSQEVDREYHKLLPLVLQLSLVVAQSDDVFAALRQLSEDDSLSEAQRRLVLRYTRDAWHSGIGIEAPEPSRKFLVRQHNLARAAAEYATNIAADEREEVWLATSPEDVEDMPVSVLLAAALAARRDGHENATIGGGPWSFTASPVLGDAVLRYCRSAEVRRQAYLARARRGMSSENDQIAEQMVRMRRGWALDVGHESYADMAFTQRMATERQAYAFLESLRAASLPAARAELQELQTFAKESGEEGDLMAWDVDFWRERLRDKRNVLSLDRPHKRLTVPRVLETLFGVVKRLFGVEISEQKSEKSLWHSDVRMFHLVDVATGVPLAAFTLDLYRAARKRRSGFWIDVALRYSEELGYYGVPRRPVVHIVGDVQPVRRERKVARMSLGQVQGLFRAFGDALQELLTEQEEGLMAGSRGLESDAVGVPGRFLELWALDLDTLRSMGLSPEDAEAAAATRRFHSGARVSEEVRLALTDLELHARYKPGAGETSVELADRIASESVARAPGAEERTLSHFSASFVSGLASGYYADLWAQVLAADAFEAFRGGGDGGDSGVDDERLGRLFRSSLLAPGGGRSPLASFREFRGRSPLIAPLLRSWGLRPPAPQSDGGDGGAGEGGGLQEDGRSS